MSSEHTNSPEENALDTGDLPTDADLTAEPDETHRETHHESHEESSTSDSQTSEDADEAHLLPGSGRLHASENADESDPAPIP